MSLLSASQMQAIQKIGLLGMVTNVTIYEATTDSGLDEGDDPYGSKQEIEESGFDVKGWLVGKWAYDRNADVGDIDTTTNYRLRLPVGTSISPGWRVGINGNNYSVTDVGDDQTWPEWLNVNLRRAK